uniref:putative F-box/LRR-repeat protein 23 n=1 Tax=Fragaria vesca subsp. vesca TaxID=101020 RepID=UPI0005C7ECCC|nr:PREDICTED: putative F-box/LRR-repeat protein 23 [Fragaria vesca subsp. vesca]
MVLTSAIIALQSAPLNLHDHKYLCPRIHLGPHRFTVRCPHLPLQKEHVRDWTQLPHDVTASILSRLGAVDILETGQMDCKTWHKVCKDPLMWRVVDFRYDDLHRVKDLAKMCRHVVDRSAGKLASINLDFFAYSELLKYITDRYCFNCSEFRVQLCHVC